MRLFGVALAVPALWQVSFAGKGLDYTRPDFDERKDEDLQNVARLEKKIAESPLKAKYGIVMAAGPEHAHYMDATIPIWKAYAEKHKMDFWLQTEPLNTDWGFDWTLPRVLTELVPAVKWRYALIVEPHSLPANFNKSWEYAIKMHMRHKRFKSDSPEERIMFCPWDCEKDYMDQYAEQACYGPLLTGCILYVKKLPRSLDMMKEWYNRRGDYFDKGTALMKGYEKMRERHFDQIHFKDIRKEMGDGGNFIATFKYDAEKYKYDRRTWIHDFIKSVPQLSIVANKMKTRDELEKREKGLRLAHEREIMKRDREEKFAKKNKGKKASKGVDLGFEDDGGDDEDKAEL